MIFDIEIDFESQILALFDTNSQNSIISFAYVDPLAKIFPILYPRWKTLQPV